MRRNNLPIICQFLIGSCLVLPDLFFFVTPLVNPSYFKELPNSQWAIAKAPYGEHLEKGPTEEEVKNGFLSEEHLKYLGNLTSICFGDEEHYKDGMVDILKAWYEVSRKLYPDVLVHNNQWHYQWKENQMRNYIQNAKPDMITYDYYLFDTSKDKDYKGAKDMAAHLLFYRNLAIDGWDGNKGNYLAFGQYLQGYARGQDRYKLTESQLRLYYYMTWTFGGKWLNCFRFLQGQGNPTTGATTPTTSALLLEQGIPGKPTKHMDWVNTCNTESKYISDYLVRLKTKSVAYVPGSGKYTEGTPDKMSVFDPKNSYVKKIDGSLELDLSESADMYIGFFDIIPKEEQGDPDFFKEENPAFFMLTNGYTSMTHDTADPLKQQVTLQIDFKDFGVKKLSWINPKKGVKEEIKLKAVEGNIYTFQVALPGGSGGLFIVE